MTDPVAAALAWVDQLSDHMDCHCYDTLTTLAAEVRRLQAINSSNVGLLDACEDLAVQLEAATQRQHAAEASLAAQAKEVHRLHGELALARNDEDVCCHGVGFDRDCEACDEVERMLHE